MKRAKEGLSGHFKIIFDALQKEDRDLRKLSKRFDYDPKHYTGRGLYFLDEKHLQYVLFKNLLKRGNFQVYMEDCYKKKKGRCDLTLYDPDPDSKREIWIEIKASRWWKNMERSITFKRWIDRDFRKLRSIHREGVEKYLLLLWIEDEKPNIRKWRIWFKENFKKVKFHPSVLGHFGTTFSDEENYRTGNYVVCLLKVV